MNNFSAVLAYRSKYLSTMKTQQASVPFHNLNYFLKNHLVKIWACTACAKLVQRLEEHEMFQHAIATASKNNFVWFHNRISSQFQLLSILVPRYTDMVMNNPTVERLEVHQLRHSLFFTLSRLTNTPCRLQEK